MRISDWSSDVCSSDLYPCARPQRNHRRPRPHRPADRRLSAGDEAMSYDGDYVARDARFFILRALTEEIDGQSNSVNLRRMLDAQGIRRDPDWLVTQLTKLGALHAVTVHPVGRTAIARNKPDGRV